VGFTIVRIFWQGLIVELDPIPLGGRCLLLVEADMRALKGIASYDPEPTKAGSKFRTAASP
jgi:hypothetical protein